MHMHIAAIVLLAALICIPLDGYASGGRQPCDRGAGGISHCENGKFICNNGTVSRSKKVCIGSGGEGDGLSASTKAKKKGKQK